MQAVFNLLESIAPLEPGLKDYLSSRLRKFEPGKDAILLKEGEIARTLGFIEKGLVRGFRTSKSGAESTTWFMGDGDVYASVRSFFTQQPSWETLQTLEPCLIWLIEYNDLRYSHTHWKSFQEHRAELLEKYYLLAEERDNMRLQEDNYDSFCFLVKNYRYLLDRSPKVPEKLLASFLNTTHTYFSHLKRRYLDEHDSF